MPNNPHGNSVLETTLNNLAGILSFVLSFLITPQIFEYTSHWVNQYIAQHYGLMWLQFVDIGWFITIFILVFSFSRLALIALIKMMLLGLGR